MHTSLEIPQTHCMSGEGARPTVPSPLVGEGQGEGWAMKHRARGLSRAKSRERRLAAFVRSRLRTDAALLYPSPCPSPNKGGGNAVAPLCPTADQHSYRCVH